MNLKSESRVGSTNDLLQISYRWIGRSSNSQISCLLLSLEKRADCSISLKFCTEFDPVWTHDTRSTNNVQGRWVKATAWLNAGENLLNYQWFNHALSHCVENWPDGVLSIPEGRGILNLFPVKFKWRTAPKFPTFDHDHLYSPKW